MGKLLNWLDKHFLEVGIGFLLFFIPLYPKLPLIGVRHTWVYIRWEDFLVALVVVGWLIQLLRRKVSLKLPLTLPIILYWLVGGVSLLFSLVFLRSHLANFFPQVAVFHFLRRLEYMVLFFVAASTVKDIKKTKKYFLVIGLALLGVCFYGFGQKYLGFPAFLTMNEEFAKGIPLYLPPSARVTSTFAGHYDLSAFLVLMIALFTSLIFALKKPFYKILVFLLVFASFILLLLTASRISFAVYLVAIVLVFWLHKKKWLIIPVVLISILLMNQISGTSQRFGKTFRIKDVVYDVETGRPLALLESEQEVGKIFTEEEEIAQEDLPVGSGFLPVPLLQKEPTATQAALIKRPIATALKTATMSSEIATVSGEFLIKRTIVYDISFTTRFQGTWPRALKAFYRNPILGSGYSSVALAADNSYLRALGETGLLGLLAFLSILGAYGLLIRQSLKKITQPFARSVLIGTAAGTLGIALNATLIDIFEASKVAFTFWPLLGLSVGLIIYCLPRRRSLIKETIEVIKLPVTPIIVFLVTASLMFFSSFKNYFVGDDFTWLHWTAKTRLDDLFQVFLDAKGFFYRPLARVYFFLVYPLFGLQPQGFHLVDFLFHFGCTLGVYLLTLWLTKKRLVAFLASLFFLIHPVNAESIFWISSTSHLMANFFYIWGFLAYVCWRRNLRKWRWFFYIFALLAFALGLSSHERMITFPLAILFYDLVFGQIKKSRKWLAEISVYLPFWVLTSVYFWLRGAVAQAHGLSGDYSYNLKNFAFNFVGNLIGYLGELIASFHFIPWYDLSRTFLRIHKPIALGLLVVLILIPWLFFKKVKLSKTTIFAFGWLVILLLPFLGLGNLAERYVYLAHAGFFIALAIWLVKIFEKLKKRNLKLAILIFILLVGGLLTFWGLEIKKAQKEWYQAGEIANKTLLALSTNYREFPLGTTLYFVNLPIRQGRAWVFPVGLEDGLWFVYQDENLTIERSSDLEAMFDLVGQPKSHVFVFEQGELKEMKKE